MTEYLLSDDVWWYIISSYIDPEYTITCLYAVCKSWGCLIKEKMLTYSPKYGKIANTKDFLFERMPRLRTLNLYTLGFYFKYDSLSRLSALTALELPRIQEDLHHQAKNILLLLPRYTSLTSLTLCDARYRIPQGVTTQNLQTFRAHGSGSVTDSMVIGFTALRSLSLFHCEITDKSVSVLTNLTSLVVFALRDRSAITSDSLRRLPFLVHLNINTRVDLSLLTSLNSLVLNYVPHEHDLYLLTGLRKLAIHYHTIHLTHSFVTSLSHLSSLKVMNATLDRSLKREDLTHLVELVIEGRHHDVKNTRDFQLEHFYDGPVDWALIGSPGYRGRWR